ncbi:MAG: hypothetical protein WB777_25960 [Mycobacterium sp.]
MAIEALAIEAPAAVFSIYQCRRQWTMWRELSKPQQNGFRLRIRHDLDGLGAVENPSFCQN